MSTGGAAVASGNRATTSSRVAERGPHRPGRYWGDIGKACGWKHPGQTVVEGEGGRSDAGFLAGLEGRLHGYSETPRGGGGEERDGAEVGPGPP